MLATQIIHDDEFCPVLIISVEGARIKRSNFTGKLSQPCIRMATHRFPQRWGSIFEPSETFVSGVLRRESSLSYTSLNKCDKRQGCCFLSFNILESIEILFLWVAHALFGVEQNELSC